MFTLGYTFRPWPRVRRHGRRRPDPALPAGYGGGIRRRRAHQLSLPGGPGRLVRCRRPVDGDRRGHQRPEPGPSAPAASCTCARVTTATTRATPRTGPAATASPARWSIPALAGRPGPVRSAGGRHRQRRHGRHAGTRDRGAGGEGDHAAALASYVHGPARQRPDRQPAARAAAGTAARTRPIRWKNARMAMALYRLCREYLGRARKMLQPRRPQAAARGLRRGRALHPGV